MASSLHKLNNSLQPLMNINVVFIYCLTTYDKNKNALQQKGTQIHQKYLATVRRLVSPSLAISAPRATCPAIPPHH